MLTVYGKREWLTILAIGLMLTAATLLAGLWWLSILTIIMTGGGLSFFRDPHRRVPTQRGMVVSPADGCITSIHEIEKFEPLAEPAVCIRIFLSVFNVHVNRSPCHAVIHSITYRSGKHRNAMSPDSAKVNESNLIVFCHPTRGHRIAAIRQVAGLLARSIVCEARKGQIFQRGQRLGMIKLCSTTELYLPASLHPQVLLEVGQHAKGGLTILAETSTPEQEAATAEAARPTDAAQNHGSSSQFST